MRARTWFWGVAAAAVLAVVVWPDTQSTVYYDTLVARPDHPVDSTVELSGGWRAELFAEADCVQITNGTLATNCMSMQYQPGDGMTMIARSGSVVLSWAVYGSDGPLTARWYSRDGVFDRDFVQLRPGLWVSMRQMSSDDQPWGVSVWDTTKGRVGVSSFLRD